MAARQAPAVPRGEGRLRLSPARLPRRFFARPAVEVAPDLLGRVLVRREPDGSLLRGRIVEAEAYEPGDPASHGFRGRTPRNATMFGRPGVLYVYLTYGQHWMMNAVARAAGEPCAVLIRALEPIEGEDTMASRRGWSESWRLCSGPAKTAQALGVDGSLDGTDLVSGSSVWIQQGRAPDRDDVAASTRIGLTVATERPWRFYLRGNRHVTPGRAGLSRGRPATP